MSADGTLPLTAPTMMPSRDVPVIINSFNRLASLARLVDWLRDAGQRNIIIIDNASQYPPLLEYLDNMNREEDIRVVRLPGNYGPKAIWEYDLLTTLNIDTEYVYTDPDVVPADFCPSDVVAHLQRILQTDNAIPKAGLGLRLDDIPDCYRLKSEVVAWENQFWLSPAAPGLFLATIDTTFALYRPHSGHCLGPTNIRTGWPYLAAHESWYGDSLTPTEEEQFYARSAAPATSNWSIDALPEPLREAIADTAQRHPNLLHFGTKGDPWPGYLNPACSNGRLQLPEGSIDGIYYQRSSLQAAELPSINELHRVAKDDAKLLVRLPAGPTDDQLRDLVCGGLWWIERMMLVLDSALKEAGEDNLRDRIRSDRNLVREAIIHLRAIKDGGLAHAPTVDWLSAEIVFSPIDMDAGFVRV